MSNTVIWQTHRLPKYTRQWKKNMEAHGGAETFLWFYDYWIMWGQKKFRGKSWIQKDIPLKLLLSHSAAVVAVFGFLGPRFYVWERREPKTHLVKIIYVNLECGYTAECSSLTHYSKAVKYILCKMSISAKQQPQLNQSELNIYLGHNIIWQ